MPLYTCLVLCTAAQVGFLYLRYVADPRQLWSWLGPYCDDKEVRPGLDPLYLVVGWCESGAKACALCTLCALLCGVAAAAAAGDPAQRTKWPNRVCGCLCEGPAGGTGEQLGRKGGAGCAGVQAGCRQQHSGSAGLASGLPPQVGNNRQ